MKGPMMATHKPAPTEDQLKIELRLALCRALYLLDTLDLKASESQSEDETIGDRIARQAITRMMGEGFTSVVFRFPPSVVLAFGKLLLDPLNKGVQPHQLLQDELDQTASRMTAYRFACRFREVANQIIETMPDSEASELIGSFVSSYND